jgi:hypothetical protein
MQQFPTATAFTAPLAIVTEIYRLERRAYKNLVTKNALYNTISTIHKRQYPKHVW